MYTNWNRKLSSEGPYSCLITLKLSNGEEKEFAEIFINYSSNGDIYHFSKEFKAFNKIPEIKDYKIKIVVKEVNLSGKITFYQFYCDQTALDQIIRKLEKSDEDISTTFSLCFKIINWKNKKEAMKSLIKKLFEIKENLI